MIRRFLQREFEFLLAELGAPDARTLWRRIAFHTYVYTATAAVLLGLLAVYDAFGLAAMYGVIFVLFILYLRLQRCAPIYFEGAPCARPRWRAGTATAEPAISAGAGHAAARPVEYGAHHQASTRVAEKQSQVKRQELAERILKG